MTDSMVSKNSVTIQLTEERWGHIVAGHPEMRSRRRKVVDAVEAPDRILEGGSNELLAVKQSGARGWLVVVYKEENAETGFVITAFRTTRAASLNRRRQLWP